MEIIEVTPTLRDEYNDKLRSFEHIFQYPIGEDSFSIDHGRNYFQFFDRMGKTYIYVGEENKQVVAVVIIVLRDIDIHDNGDKEKVWYICDLKIHPSYRGRFFAQHFIKRIYKEYNHLSSKVYGISMDSLDRPNKLIHFASRVNDLSLKLSGKLNFYLLNIEQLNILKPLLIKRYNSLNFICLSGRKDLIISSTKRALHILHFSINKYEEIFLDNADNLVQYMFCFSGTNTMNNKFVDLGIFPIATASIISNIENSNWDFIETSEI